MGAFPKYLLYSLLNYWITQIPYSRFWVTYILCSCCLDNIDTLSRIFGYARYFILAVWTDYILYPGSFKIQILYSRFWISQFRYQRCLDIIHVVWIEKIFHLGSLDKLVTLSTLWDKVYTLSTFYGQYKYFIQILWISQNLLITYVLYTHHLSNTDILCNSLNIIEISTLFE